MNTNYIHKITLLLLFPVMLLAQQPTIITPQPIGNLFDGNLATNWVSSFNGEQFPIDLEVQFGATETVFEVMLRQINSATALVECQVVDFELFIRQTGETNFPEKAIYKGTMETSTTTRQWFTLEEATTGNALRIRINKVSGTETFHAALNELGIRSSRKNGSVASSAYNLNNPGTWNGISWTNEQPYQVVAINWMGRSLMTGDFNPDLFAKLEGNYDFRNTQINVISSLITSTVEMDVIISPTVANHSLNIYSVNSIISVEAINLLGQRHPLTVNNSTIDISTLERGHYIVCTITDKGRFNTKIIKY
jgi:hypothetical protein